MQLKELGTLFDALDKFKNTGNILSATNNVLAGSFGNMTASEILASVATAGLSDAQKVQLVQLYALDGANYTTAESILALSASQTASTTATAGFSSAIKGLGVQLKALIVANPVITAIAAIGAAVFAAVKIYDALNVSLEEAKENLSESKSAFSDLSSDMQKINSELETNKKRIDELNAKGKLSYVEEGELNNLQKINAELERNAAIKNIELEKSATALSKDNKTAFDKEYGDDSFSREDVTTLLAGYSDNVTPYELENKGLEGVAAALTIQRERLAEAERAFDEAKDDYDKAKSSGDEGAVSAAEYVLDNAKTQVENEQVSSKYFEDKLTGNLTALAAYQDSLKDIMNYRDLTDGEQEFYDNLEQGMKLIYSYTDPNQWNQFELDKIFNSEDIEMTKDEFLRMAKAGKLDPDSIKGFDKLNDALNSSNIILEDSKDSADAFCDAMYSWADADDAIIGGLTSMETLTDSVSNLHNATSGILADINALSNAFAEQADNGYLSTDTMLKLANAGYATALMFDAETGSCTLNRDAMLELAESKLTDLEASIANQQSGIIEELKRQNVEAYKTADGFLTLADSKSAAAAGIDIDGYTTNFNDLTVQQKAIDNLRKNINNSDFGKKSSVSGAKSSSSSSASDPVKDAFQKEYDALKHLRDMEQITDIDYFNEVDALNQKYYNGKTKYLTDYQKYEQEVYKGLQSAYKDLVEKQTDLLEAELDAGMIDYQTYSSTVTNLLDNMYAQGKISAANYWDFVKAKLESQLAIYDSALKGVTTLLDDEIDKWQDKIDVIEAANDKLEEQKDFYDSVLDAVSSVLEDEIDLWEDKISALEEENDGIEELVSNYDSVLSVVEKVYDKEINLINEQKNTIQEKIDAINDENSALDLQYRKSQALYELERSQQQRTKKVYGGENGYVYTTDDSAIRDAQSTLHDIETEELINSLEKEQESLQNDIDLLEEYKQKWLEVSNAYADIQNDLLARKLLGEDYETLILLNNDLDIEDFKNKYIEAQQRMDDNSDLITSYEEKVECYEQLKEQWASIADEHEDSVNRQNAALQFGADWEQELLAGRLTAITDFSVMYSEIQAQIESNEGLITSYNEKIDYYQKLKEQWNSISEEYERQKDRQNAAMVLGKDWESSVLSGRIDTLNKFKDGYISLQQQIVDAAWNSANEQIRAAKEAEKAAAGSVGGSGNSGSNTSSNSGPTKETKRPSRPSTWYDPVTGKKGTGDPPKNTGHNIMTKYAYGGRLHSYDNSYDISVPGGEDHVSTIAWRNGERILSPSQNKNFEELTVNLPDILKSAQTLKNLIQMNPVNYAAMLDVSKYTESLCHLAKGNESNTTFQIGDIHLHEVSDVDTFAETIVRQLPGKMLQAIHKRQR